MALALTTTTSEMSDTPTIDYIELSPDPSIIQTASQFITGWQDALGNEGFTDWEKPDTITIETDR